jgi:hypothetical protein
MIAFQRIENLALAALAAALFATNFSWWWLAVVFLAFDLSMVGYAVNERVGAWVYNAGHSYLAPAGVGLVALAGIRWALFLALAWAFHIGVDRALGYGLKLTDGFAHTHLGVIGAPARNQ